LLPDSNKRVLFVGERIQDVYHYGKLLGRPLKEAIVCIEHQDTEVFEGGVVAAAAHARDFVAGVHIFSTCEVRKERYLEASHHRKLFEVYGGNVDHALMMWPALESYDAVIVTDYGHGMMTPAVVEKLCRESKFLAVNVQTNSGNYGFNLATKYPNADYLCVDEPEARLATQNRDGDIRLSLDSLARIAGMVVVTLGRDGSIGWSEKEGFVKVPAFTDRVVDTMGAGDAFFAVTACMAEEASLADLMRIGNAAGALKAQTVGHRKPITKNELLDYLNR